MSATQATPKTATKHTWIIAVAVVALLPALLPFTLVAAIFCAVPAALWWLSGSSSTHNAGAPAAAAAAGAAAGAAAAAAGAGAAAAAPEAEEQAAAMAATTQAGAKEEDLGLPPPKSNVRSGMVSGRASVTDPTRSRHQQQQLATSKAVSTAQSKKLPDDSPLPAGAAAAAQAGEPLVVLAVNSNTTRLQERSNPFAGMAAAAATATAALPAVESAAPSATSQQEQPEQQQQAEVPAALTGSAAILAKLRAQRGSSSAASSRPSSASAAATLAAKAPARATLLYASQTGTGQEIARTIHAECTAQGLPADVMSMNELGFDSLARDTTPLVVVIASSTGDGDPPDNAAAAYMALKKQQPAGRLAGIKFSVLGLGDSNYTRFMHVPRAIKSRLQELGAECFYQCAEADEVDGLEDTVDPWCEGITHAIAQELQQLNASRQQDVSAAPAPASSLSPAATASPAAAGSLAGSRQATPPAEVSRQFSNMSAEPSRNLLAAVTRQSDGSAADKPSVAMELSAVSGSSSLLSGRASLLGEDSAISQGGAAAPAAAAAAPTAEPAAAAVPAAAVAAAAAAGTPPATPPVQLVNGLAPAGVDLKGVPPLAPCRIQLNLQVPPSVAEEAAAKEASLPTMDQKFYRDFTGAYSAAAPFWATISDARLMTAEWSDRTVLHVELDVADSGMRFAAGDAVGVLPQNDAALVSSLLSRLGMDGDQVFEVQAASGDSISTSPGSLLAHIPWPCSLRHAFSHCTDLTSVPRKSLLRLLAEHCSDEDERRTLLFFTSRAGREAYAEEITSGQPSLLDLLRRFPSCSPPVDALLDALPPLAPRMYSLTNAPVAAECGVPGATGPSKLQFALSVVEFGTKYGTRHGVATTWLAKLCRPWLAGMQPSGLPQVWVPVFLRRAVDFKPPASLATPMLMIGPGTGVAPFRGFLQQRLTDMLASGESSPAPATLYFGCRRPDEDYLYEQDWRALAESGALQTLRVAFSRQQDSKVYVQHLLREDACAVARVVSAGGHVYVCGDGAQMAKDVHGTLLGVLRDELGMSEQEAAQELAAMAKGGRYVRDIWS